MILLKEGMILLKEGMILLDCNYKYINGVGVDPTFLMSEPEITAFVLFGLGLTAKIAFQTLSRLSYDSLTILPRDMVIGIIKDTADDELMEGINHKLDVLCGKAGVPLPQGSYKITDSMFDSGDDFDDIHFCYHDLLAHGLTSGTFSYAMGILTMMQDMGPAV